MALLDCRHARLTLSRFVERDSMKTLLLIRPRSPISTWSKLALARCA